MTTREKMLEQALRLLVIDLKNRATERGIEYPQFAMECAEKALALPADDAGSARTAEVPGTGECGDCEGLGMIYDPTPRQPAKRCEICKGTGKAPVTNARDGRASDNNGEARDVERYRWLRSHINDPVSSYTNVFEPTPEQLDSIVDAAMEAGRYDEKKRQRKIAAQKDKP